MNINAHIMLIEKEYKMVNNEYLRNKIIKGEYEKKMVKKVGNIQARTLNHQENVIIYYYNHCAEIEEMLVTIKGNDNVLVTKSIGGRHYNSIMNGLSFHKHYTNFNKHNKEYMPVVDPFRAYEINEHIKFINMYGQEVTLNPGDLICPYDTAKFTKIYSIYRYNFDDNYEFIKNYDIY